MNSMVYLPRCCVPLGFDVAMLSAQVADTKGDFGPEFDHMTLMVRLDERWLVDVGFGDSFLTPLLLDARSVQAQGHRSYQILPEGPHLTLMQRLDGEDWKAQYSFTLKLYQYPDYAEMCHYHQTSPESHFTRARICSRATTEGRVTISGMRFISSLVDGERQERELRNEVEYEEMLREHFGIIM